VRNHPIRFLRNRTVVALLVLLTVLTITLAFG
jgi:hypothetical protein